MRPLALDLLRLLRPGRSDVGQDIERVIFGQDTFECRHTAVEILHATLRKGCLSALQDVIYQELGIVVPRVTGHIMRRGRQNTVGTWRPPIGLAFQICPVAGRTVFSVKSGTDLHIAAR